MTSNKYLVVGEINGSRPIIASKDISSKENRLKFQLDAVNAMELVCRLFCYYAD